MKILFIGDIVGKSAREKLKDNISFLKRKYEPDVFIANAENATSGYGLSKNDAKDLLSSGVDVLTLGNHAWDQREMLTYIEECPKIVRAINYPNGVPGKGYYKLELLNGKKITVVQVMLRLFMGMSLDDPFNTAKSSRIMYTMQENFVDLYSNTRTVPLNVTIKYLRRPINVNLVEGIGCELAEHTHHEIVEMTVKSILEAFESPRYQSQSGEVLESE